MSSSMRRRYSQPKELPYITNQVQNSSRRYQVVRTKKLAHSHFGTPVRRRPSHSEVSQYQEYDLNQQLIRNLREYLNRITMRKNQLSNPEYSSSLDEDISTWQNSITVLKGEIASLKKQSTIRIKKVPDERKLRQLQKQVQGQRRDQNNLTEELAIYQKQIDYIREKNKEKEMQIQLLQDQQDCPVYLNKLKQIQLLQNSSSNIIRKLQQRYSSTQKQLKNLQQTIFQHESRIACCDQLILSSMNQLNELLLLQYGGNRDEEQSIV